VVLDRYRRKRDFQKTPEPEGGVSATPGGRLFVIQKHAARRLHYDLRLELGGVLKSWAVPKGPSLDPKEKRLAVEVEDHPIDYGDFEGVIPAHQYGAGTVLVWDYGQWEPEGDPEESLAKGNLKFKLHGRKLKGAWALVRMNKPAQADKHEWLLIKHRDAEAVGPGADSILTDAPASVLSGREMDQVARDRDRMWQEGRSVAVAPPAGGVESIEPSRLPGARKADMPERFSPQTARTVAEPPAGDDWLHEIKYDGYRLLCLVQDKRVRLITRNGLDWTERFAGIAREAADLPVHTAILDGEATILRADGTTDFQALQNFFKGRKSGKLVFYLFDLPYCQGYDLTAVPLLQRKALLKALVQSKRSAQAAMLLSGEIQGQGEEVYRNACRLGVEGIVSKRTDAIYEQRRASSWVKVKCILGQEFVIGGYSESKAAPAGLRSLLVGYYQAGRLTYAGRVGTGFSIQQRSDLKRRLEGLRQRSAPFDNPPKGKDLHWASPQLVAEVAFSEWTQERLLRHPVFKGLREDKPADQVALETPASPADGETVPPKESASASRKPTSVSIAGVRLTHPERILYPHFGITKADLARYYQQVADRMLPYITGRPLSLVRCPQGSTGACFYQKHFSETLPEPLKPIAIREENEEKNYIYIEDLAGLIALVQINVLEIHPWGCRIDRLEAPDTLIFDIDPDPQLPWEHVVHAAWHLRGILQGRGFSAFVKNSGGKGLHVQMPLDREADWNEVKTYAHDVAALMAAQQPQRYTANARKASRKGKIYIDYLRNARGATSVAPYSTRARTGAPVSTPLFWEELSSRLGPDAFTVNNLPDRLTRLKNDPWNDYARIRNSL